MAQKPFYLVARKDVRIKGHPVFYCRFRNAQEECCFGGVPAD